MCVCACDVRVLIVRRVSCVSLKVKGQMLVYVLDDDHQIPQHHLQLNLWPFRLFMTLVGFVKV